MWVVKFGLVLVVAYAVLVGVVFLAQTWLLFPTGLAAASGEPVPGTAVRLEIATPDGERLYGLRIPPVRNGADPPALVIGFGGNAWNTDSLAVYLHELYPDVEVVAFAYRGYPPSSGRPSAAALLADAPLVHDRALDVTGAERAIVVGFSIGSAVAADLAGRRPLAGLVLVSPFDSLEALAREHYPWIPVAWLLRHHLPVVETLRGLTVPTALIAAGRDTIVPPRRTNALRRAIPAPLLDRTIADANHNDIYQRAEFRAAMIEALDIFERAQP